MENKSNALKSMRINWKKISHRVLSPFRRIELNTNDRYVDGELNDFVGESFACETVGGIIIIISKDQW